MADSLRKTPAPQPSRVFDTSTPILELPSQHVAMLHGRARTGGVAVATRSPGWRERSVPVEDLSRYLEWLPVGQDIYLSQARFHGPRKIVNLRRRQSANRRPTRHHGPDRNQAPVRTSRSQLDAAEVAALARPPRRKRKAKR